MKNKTIKFIIVITLFIISLIGIFNFTDYLSLPKTLFFSSLEESFNDYSYNLNEIKKNKLLKVLNNENLTVTMGTILNVNGKHKDIINNTKFNTNALIKRNDNYLYSSTISNYKGKDILEYVYVNNKLFKSKLNYMYYNPDMSIILGSIIKDNINKNIVEDRFKLTKEDININDLVVKCNKVEYILTGKELNKIYNDIIKSIESNKTLKNYLTKLYSTDNIKNIFDDLKFNGDDNYKLVTFTRLDGDKAVKIVLESEDSEIYSYSIYENYKLLKTKNGYINYKKDGKKNIVILNGTRYKIEINYETIKDKNTGKIKIDDKNLNKNILHADYDYMINNVKGNITNIDLGIKSKVIVEEKTVDMILDSKIKIDNSKIENIELKESNKLGLKESIKDMFLKLYNNKEVKN